MLLWALVTQTVCSLLVKLLTFNAITAFSHMTKAENLLKVGL